MKMMSSILAAGIVLGVGGGVGGVAAQGTVAELREPVQSVASVPEAGAAQVKDGLFDGTEKFAAGAKEVTEVNMDKNMLGMVGGKGGGMAKNIDFVVVHTYEYEKAGMYRKEDVEVFRRRLTDGNWSCFIHTQEKNESTDVCQRISGDHETNELVVISVEPKELTFVHLKGHVSLADLQKLGGMGFGPGNAGTPTAPTPPLQPRKQ